MAKPPTVVPFTYAERLISVGDFSWTELRAGTLLGGPRGRTLSRVKLYYQMAYEVGLKSNGVLDEVVMVSLAETVGDPPPFPGSQPVFSSTGSVNEQFYRELPRFLSLAGSGSVFGPAEGVVDAKPNRPIPPSPAGLQLWIGVQRFNDTGPVSGGTVELRGWGFLVFLANP